jgi:putative Ca2+/H+ antiporter (TMEM165/GDT1 family)
MDVKMFASVFGIVFLAELGDKTQLATVLFASQSAGNLMTVFFGASLALLLTTAMGVAAGGIVAQYVSPKVLSIAAGSGFLLIGLWTLWRSMGPG